MISFEFVSEQQSMGYVFIFYRYVMSQLRKPPICESWKLKLTIHWNEGLFSFSIDRIINEIK